MLIADVSHQHADHQPCGDHVFCALAAPRHLIGYSGIWDNKPQHITRSRCKQASHETPPQHCQQTHGLHFDTSFERALLHDTCNSYICTSPSHTALRDNGHPRGLHGTPLSDLLPRHLPTSLRLPNAAGRPDGCTSLASREPVRCLDCTLAICSRHFRSLWVMHAYMRWSLSGFDGLAQYGYRLQQKDTPGSGSTCAPLFCV